jgi:hypothetical protein
MSPYMRNTDLVNFYVGAPVLEQVIQNIVNIFSQQKVKDLHKVTHKITINSEIMALFMTYFCI